MHDKHARVYVDDLGVLRKKKVRCITDNLVFQTLSHAGKYYLVNPTYIRYVCEGSAKICSGRTFEWVEADNPYPEIPRDSAPPTPVFSPKQPSDTHYKETNLDGVRFNSRRVLCIETNVTYVSINEAAEQTNSHATAIQSCCAGKRKSTNGLHFKYAKRAKRIKHIITQDTKFTYQYHGGIKVRVYKTTQPGESK